MTRAYEKHFTRGRDLIIAECWYLGERYALQKAVEGATYFNPLFIYGRESGLEIYYDMNNDDTDIQPIFDYYKANPDAFFKELDLFKQDFDEMKKLLEENKIKNLARLVELAKESWAGLVAIVVIGRKGDEAGFEEIAAAGKKLRYETDKLEYEIYEGIIKLVRKKYPKLGGLADLLLASEAVSGDIPSLIELKKRDEQFIYFEGVVYTDYSIDQLQKDHDLRLLQPVVTDTTELYGQIAQQGKINGTVRVLLTPNDLSTFQNGEILVTPMTTPDYMPAIIKAKALITDEGGITCHAAIVARELKKPCIIGTKIATQVLKDGNEVEVDADEGVVRILSR